MGNEQKILNEEKRLKILFLTPRFPWPVIGGDRLKPYNVLLYLGKKHDVTFVTFYQGKNVPENYIKEIKKLGVELLVIPLNPVKAALRHIFNTFFKLPLEIGYYYQPNFRIAVDKLINENHYDIAFAFFMRTAEYLKNYNIKKILMAEDCRTVYQKRSYRNTKNIIQKIVRWWEYRRLRTYEPEIVNHFDITTLVTEHDIKSMQEQNPNVNYRLLTNGTDIDKFKMPSNDFSSRKDILFAGKLDIWANVLMIRDIVKNIFPLIKSEVNDCILNIAGANPSSYINSLESNSIKIHADVPDMVPFLQSARVFIHPHTGGSGIQNKLLEAMACGCPVVTTPTGIQGIPATDGVDVLIGKTPEELASQTVRLLKDNELARKISMNGRLLIERTHSWEAVFTVLDEIITETMNTENGR
jgi:glycosyltransferase involved in cell wall biosynthesis